MTIAIGTHRHGRSPFPPITDYGLLSHSEATASVAPSGNVEWMCLPRIADELTEDGLVLRYRVQQTDDGLSGEEGTFTICSFWLVSALVEIGEVDRARDTCENLLSHASPLGLGDLEQVRSRDG